jgi:polyprenyl P-hydroxybenzoate/phenylacrylic acid decarboxylase-like protein
VSDTQVSPDLSPTGDWSGRSPSSEPQRLIVGISGASGAVLGIRLLQVLARSAVETHVVISPSAAQTISSETDWTVRQVEALAKVVHSPRDIGATIASGSFRTMGMVIAPCSVKTMSSIAYGITDDLIARAADVCLKEGRPVVALFRETPLHVGHLRALTQFAEMGGIVFPPVPAFYARPNSVDDMVTQTVGRVLDRLNIDNDLVTRWAGLKENARRNT